MMFKATDNKGIQRRPLLAALVGAGVLGGSPAALSQAAWKPSGPVKIVVPFPPGGAADILARFLGPSLSERFGQPVLIENRAGATGSIGSAHVYSAPADGATLLLGVADSVSIYPHIAKTGIDATRFVPLSGLAATAFVVLGRPDLPADSVQELIALMKKQPLSYASAGTGSGPHMMALAFSRAAKVDNMLHVPFTGMAPALNAIMARQVDILLVAVGGATQYRSRLKFYGVTSEARVAALPDIPTLAEQGVPIVGEAWMGLLAPPNTPSATSAALAKAVGEVVASNEFQAKVRELGMRTLAGSQADFSKYYLDEYRKWGELVRAANVKLE